MSPLGLPAVCAPVLVGCLRQDTFACPPSYAEKAWHHEQCGRYLESWQSTGERPTSQDIDTCTVLTRDVPPSATRLIRSQSNFFAALDDSDNEGKAPAPVVAKKKEKLPPPPKKEVVEPSKVESRP
jgi:hypothetical protein